MSHVVHVPCILDQDEDGVWCAATQLRPGVGAVGDGPTPEAALADLREALSAVHLQQVAQLTCSATDLAAYRCEGSKLRGALSGEQER